MIAIVDHGLGNFGSIQNMLTKIGAASVITSDRATIEASDKIILPGVGAFDTAMRNLDRLGLTAVLHRKVLEEGTPVLGICLGMQLLSKRSEEGTRSGLGWIDAETVRFQFPVEEGRLKVPHMGWNTISSLPDQILFSGIPSPCRFYFVHSYHVVCRESASICATTVYGIEFVSAVTRANIYGTQFHPEKSHKFGFMLLRNFVSV